MGFDIKLPDDEVKKIALQWIATQQYAPNGYKDVLRALLGRGYMPVWSWLDALKYAVDLCSKSYCVSVDYIVKDLKKKEAV